MSRPLTIVYMGTPDFAVPPMAALHERGYRILTVVTQPDRPKGRGRKLTPPPVKQAALKFGCPVLQPETVRTDDFHRNMADLAPDLYVVAAFGQILPQSLLDIPKQGAINIHASLLPRHRGAAPIHRAIIEGDAETGITTMMMDKGMDTGDILLMDRTPIGPTETAAELHDRLSRMGAKTILRTLEMLQSGTLPRTSQDHSRATYAPMLRKKDGQVDWSQPAETIDRLIRGVTPWPGAFTFSDGMRLKIFRASVLHRDISVPPGTILECIPGELRVATGKDALAIKEIQGQSGKRLPIDDFLCGCRLPDGSCLG
ncbi:methionyl-tRNA formyltransferase [Desulfosarcina ovata subsp. sediminis]|uniref:Methionyl-tRNA formyltransferase n=1 Tax=Desulfosarcina ovata subsp. sediminis TaxID=885957 RepID=A0A5K7ZJ32_9BACT|nr:methionyl-tRNA formyltransferase [Desulfosarcina ovata]BBO80215.1 methionyl-tRNA formyltransferase [Desulfosarcina ovata subsp. sediminis]